MRNIMEIKVPDIGDANDVSVIEILVAVGDTVTVDQSLITVESDKASMEIPSTHAGKVTALKVKLGDKVSEGSLILELDAADGAADAASGGAVQTAANGANDASGAADKEKDEEKGVATATAQAQATSTQAGEASAASDPNVSAKSTDVSAMASAPVQRHAPTQGLTDAQGQVRKLPHASPSVRKFARELGVDLQQVQGSGAHQRITHEDVRQFVKQALTGGGTSVAAVAGEGFSVLPWPKVDFSKYGAFEVRPLSRIKKISGANLHRNWVMIPHVTNHEVADITDLEALRQTLNREQSGVKVTMLAFLIKAVVAALKQFPEFNASLDDENLIVKQYYHIGFAADTPNGLVVPVIRDADQKGVLELAAQTSELAKLAREGKLAPAQMQGGCFSISSLGGIGGTHFTPIINAPEVAILGVSRAAMAPVWDGKQFQPRLQLPLSLSYDHRVIDGAAAARFNAYLASLLADFRRIAL